MTELGLGNDIKYVKAEKLFYHDGTRLKIDFQQIPDLRSFRYLVVNASDENHGTDHHILHTKLLDELGWPYLLLTCNPRNHDPKRNIFWHQDSYHQSVENFKKVDLDISASRSYDFACVIGHVRPHRIKLFLDLYKKKIYDRFFISINDTAIPLDEEQFDLDQDVMAEWEQIRNQLQNLQRVATGGLNYTWIYNDPGWADSYVHLVLETTCKGYAHTTEKTWKPVAGGQMFVIYGNPGTISTLRNQGVDVFDDYINHDHYDNEPDPKKRCTKVIEIIEEISNLDLVQVWQDTLDRRLKNQQKFWNREFQTHHYDVLMSRIRQ